ncbi:hypothetical protein, partial [Streptomyces seoulensis]|uniref:hypothetical protein n=1 Tax=Streptomyces seoulensis TaxID=73044 RepID=UPI0033BCF0F8
HVVVSLRDRVRPLAWETHYRVPPGGDVLERWIGGARLHVPAQWPEGMWCTAMRLLNTQYVQLW